MARDTIRELLINGQRPTGSAEVTGDAGDQPGACPLLDGVPTRAELPTDSDTGQDVALIYLNTSTEAVEVATPDGTGGVASGTVVDLSASVDLGIGDSGGLL